MRSLREFAAYSADKWGASIVTGLVGLVSGLTVASYNADVSNNKFYLEQQAKVADTVSKSFALYVENIRRLTALRKSFDERKAPPTDQELVWMKELATARNSARDSLLTTMDSLTLYFGQKVVTLAYDFRDWDEEQASKTYDQLPEPKEWKRRAKELFILMRSDMRGE